MNQIVIPPDDIDILLGTPEIVKVGNTDIPIHPMPLGVLASVVRDIMAVRAELAEAVQRNGGGWEAAMGDVADILVVKVPSVGATMANVELASFVQLPAGVQLNILMTALEVNLTASGDMIKKLVALASKSSELVGTWTALKGEKT